MLPTRRPNSPQAYPNASGSIWNHKPRQMKEASPFLGGQSITSPKGLVETYQDHRMQMTAIVLAMGCKREGHY